MSFQNLLLILDGGIPKVNLITRPRRFGKSLGMSTLANFLDIEREKYHRTLVHPFFAKFCVLGNRQSLKHLLAVFGDVQTL